MYARLGKDCSYVFSNKQQKFQTLSEPYKGLLTNDRKFSLGDSVYNTPVDTTVKTYIESPFSTNIVVPEETKLIQSKASVKTR